jgi:hypothetical protein
MIPITARKMNAPRSPDRRMHLGDIRPAADHEAREVRRRNPDNADDAAEAGERNRFDETGSARPDGARRDFRMPISRVRSLTETA